MARSKTKQKHKAAQIFEQYGDYLAMALGALGFLAVVGGVNDITLFPNFGSAGLFSLKGQFYSVSGTPVEWATVLASASAFAAGASNILINKIRGDPAELVSTTDGVTSLIAVTFPFVVAHLSVIQSLATSSIGMQITFIAVYLGALAHTVDN